MRGLTPAERELLGMLAALAEHLRYRPHELPYPPLDFALRLGFAKKQRRWIYLTPSGADLLDVMRYWAAEDPGT